MRQLTVFLILGIVWIFPNIGRAASNIINSQVNIFNGEVASALTSGAPLVVSSTGKVATGLTVLTTGQLTSQPTNSSTTPAQLTGATLTTPAAGTYWVFFEGTAQTGTGGNSITVYVYLNTTATGESRTIQFPTATLIDSGYPLLIGINLPGVVVSGSQSINIFWSSSASAAQKSTMLNCRLSAIRID